MNSNQCIKQQTLEQFNQNIAMATLIMPQQPNSSFSQIIKPNFSVGGLYLGSYRAVKDQYLLRKNKISAIITVGKQLNPPKFKGMLTLWVQIQDNPLSDISYHFTKCIKFIADNIRVGNVFVHCKAGISRSATVIIVYLMENKNYSLQKALQKVKSKREMINPNSGFLMQLQAFQQKIKLKRLNNHGLSLQHKESSKKNIFAQLKSKQFKQINGRIISKSSSKKVIKDKKYIMTLQYAYVSVKLSK